MCMVIPFPKQVELSVHIKRELIVPASTGRIERMVQMTNDEARAAFAARLNEAMADAGYPVRGRASRLADRFSVSPKGAGKWLSGDAIPETWRIPEIASWLGCSSEWLLSGSGEKKPRADYSRPELRVVGVEENNNNGNVIVLGAFDPWDDDTPLGKDEVELPLFKEVEFAAGSGRAAGVELGGRKLRFAGSTLRAAGVDIENAACAVNRGRSMERLIMDKATIGIDISFTKIVDGEIYAFEQDGELRVKYLYRVTGGGLRLHSENEAEFPDEFYTAEAVRQRFRILGYVFWWATLKKRPR